MQEVVSISEFCPLLAFSGIFGRKSHSIWIPVPDFIPISTKVNNVNFSSITLFIFNKSVSAYFALMKCKDSILYVHRQFSKSYGLSFTKKYKHRLYHLLILSLKTERVIFNNKSKSKAIKCEQLYPFSTMYTQQTEHYFWEDEQFGCKRLRCMN